MKTTTCELIPMETAGLESPSCFSIVAVHQDADMAVHAKSVFDSLVRQLGEDIEFEHEAWSFETLRSPSLRELAAESAASANLVLLALRGDGPMPSQVREWFRLWVPHRGAAHGALAVILESACPAPGLTLLMREVAQRAGMDYFSASHSGLGGATLEAGAIARGGLLQPEWCRRPDSFLVRPEITRWGICE